LDLGVSRAIAYRVDDALKHGGGQSLKNILLRGVQDIEPIHR
jgi:hypothetical protein